MSMTEAFAATAAQVLPVLSFAAVLEFRALFRDRPHLPEDPDPPHVVLSAYLLALLIWAGVMILQVWAEIICLQSLRGLPVASNADDIVTASIIAGLVLLVVMPLVSVLAEWALHGLRWARRSRPVRSASSDSDETTV